LSGPTAEDLEAKRLFIDAYFEDLGKKIQFLVTLREDDHEDEAYLLCLVYLEGLSNWLNLPSKDSPRHFSKALTSHSGNEELFSLVRPGWLTKALPWGSAPKGLDAALAIANSTLPDDEWMLPTELLDGVRPHLTADQLTWLEPEVWRGSIANAVYATLRSTGVHYGGVSHGLSFSSTFHGKAVPRIDFQNLYPALVSLAAHARKVSEETGDWFGIA
jgi:hypothetical protein